MVTSYLVRPRNGPHPLEPPPPKPPPPPAAGTSSSPPPPLEAQGQ
ncbi:hypothetical protein ACP70R_047384 [Stipagrostis hirtigluma subsp. patula]